MAGPGSDGSPNPVAREYHYQGSVFYQPGYQGASIPQTQARQQIYLDALATIPEIEFHYGNFLVKKTWAGLVPPDT